MVLHLKSRLQSSPRDQGALKQWGEHIHKHRHRDVLRRLRHFRKSAVTTTGAFFHELCDWHAALREIFSFPGPSVCPRKTTELCW